MKFLPVACLGVGLWGGLSFIGQGRPQTESLVLYGNFDGSLAPCGCTSPMSGGIVRAAAILKQLAAGSDEAHIILLGGYVAGRTRQDSLKLEALGAFASAVRAAGMEVSADVAALGPGELLELDQLSGHTEFSSSLSKPPAPYMRQTVRSGEFLIGAVSSDPGIAASLGGQTVPAEQAIADLILRAKQTELVSVLITDVDEDQAALLAQRNPDLKVVVYRSTSDPPTEPRRLGDTLLVTPGFHGKSVVALHFEGGQDAGYAVSSLGPDVPADPLAAKIYDRYLGRVHAEDLLAAWPRVSSAPYAGSQSCSSCHGLIYSQWKSSGHSHAFPDLVAKGHGFDPDCVSCHVVGLSAESGFRSVERTPHLADVGCESCHGPARDHARLPSVSLKKVSLQVCLPCHTPDNSPGFEEKTYWAKIRH